MIVNYSSSSSEEEAERDDASPPQKRTKHDSETRFGAFDRVYAVIDGPRESLFTSNNKIA